MPSVTHLDWSHGPALRARLAANLAPESPGPPTPTNPGLPAPPTPRRVAAVAITLVPGTSGHAELLVIMRASGLRDHGGQFGLPGGRLEDGEEAVTAARRELREELAVTLGAETLIGRLPAMTTTSGYRIHPIVLWSETPVAEVPAPDEVAEVFRLSLPELDTGAARARDHGSLPVLGTVIFAPTGEILRHFRERAMHGRDPGEGLAEPRFAWR
jgi:8-oxo-dGTP pyrophosphatase MutT (NUDIX family)